MVHYCYNLEYIYKTKFAGKLLGLKPNPFTEFRQMIHISEVLPGYIFS